MSVTFTLALICAGTPSLEAVRLNEDGGPGHNQFDAVAQRSEEGIITAWTDDRDGYDTIRVRLIPDSGDPAPDSFKISGSIPGEKPLMATSADGRLLIAWDLVSATGSSLLGWKGCWLNADGSPDGSVFAFEVDDDNMGSYTILQSLAVGVDDSILIGWQGQDSLLYTTAFDSDGDVIHGPTMFGAEEFEFGPLALARQADGSFVVAWVGRTDFYEARPKARHLDATGTPTGDEILLTPDPLQVFDIKINAGDKGKNLITWIAWEGVREIYGCVVDNYGNVENEFFSLSEDSLGSGARSMNLVKTNSHGWVVTWADGVVYSQPDSIHMRGVDADGTPRDASSRNCYDNVEGETIGASSLIGGPGATIMWTSTIDQDMNVKHRSIDPIGTEDGSIMLLSDDSDSAKQYDPTLTALPSGGFVSAWRVNTTGSNSQIAMRAFDSEGNPLTDVQYPVELPEEDVMAYQPVLASSEAGVALAWIDERDGFGKTYIQRFDTDLQPLGSNVEISTWSWAPTNTDSTAHHVDVAMQTDGSVCCVFSWPRFGDTLYRDSFIRVVGGDGTLHNMTTLNPSAFLGQDCYMPSVATLSNGGFGTTYVETLPDDNELIHYRRYNKFGVAATTSTVECYETTQYITSNSLKMNGQGQGLMVFDVAWGASGIYSQAMDEAGPVGSAQAIPPAQGTWQYSPQAALSANGTCLVTWLEYMPTESNAFRYGVGVASWSVEDSGPGISSFLPRADEGVLQEDPVVTWNGEEPVVACATNLVDGQGLDIFAFIETEPTCPGDVDGNGTVDVSDVLQVIAAWASDDSDADLNGDGTVNVDDMLLVLGGFGC
ncbi:MAG: dockerin type I domain-containing protein [Planctomycetota bacterium]|nr:dockerin type I domain-containing protein [Planctomycetota bacterium]